ncbi:DUF5763 domain-containing protein [Chlorobium sp.]|uniref:DUF5763 domain-containing protein n=1 Tax=Chlorobium sp. TaxID=1095 RepID=UPI003C6F32B8
MQCRGHTKSGKPCRNEAGANGYCRLHGGKPSGRASRRKPAANQTNMKQEQSPVRASATTGWLLLIIVLAVLYGAATGDWSEIGKLLGW